MRQLKDPNTFVSPTRLSIRDLPPDVDEAELKRVVMLGVRAFTASNPDFVWDRSAKRSPFIKQMRLLRDPSTGDSRGFAFVELRHAEVALAVLRRLNNNPTLFGRARRLDVEFAVESVHALQRLGRITKKGQEKHRGIAALRREGVADPRAEWRRREDDAKLREQHARYQQRQDGGHEHGRRHAATVARAAAGASAAAGGGAPAAAGGGGPAGGVRKPRKLRRRRAGAA